MTPPPRPRRIDQIVPSFAGRDAIGIHVLHSRDVLRSMGFESEIYCGGAWDEVKHLSHGMDELPASGDPDDWLVYHLSSGAKEGDVFGSRPERKIVDYHNITPAELLMPWAPWVGDEVVWGRRQLAELAGVSFFSLADSGYNAQEMAAVGYRDPLVVPPLFDLAAFRHQVDEQFLSERLEERAAGGSDWLFVGRVAPHKAQHDLIKAFALYRRLYDPVARLHLVGTWMGEDYPRALDRFVERLGLGDSVRVTNLVAAGQLAAFYRIADVFVCASDHEGFCVPVIEAMENGVPVVAFGSAAIPETVAQGGLVLQEKSAVTLAAAAHRVVADRDLRDRLVAAGRERARYFELPAASARLRAAVEAALAADADPPGGGAPGGRAAAADPAGAVPVPTAGGGAALASTTDGR